MNIQISSLKNFTALTLAAMAAVSFSSCSPTTGFSRSELSQQDHITGDIPSGFDIPDPGTGPAPAPPSTDDPAPVPPADTGPAPVPPSTEDPAPVPPSTEDPAPVPPSTEDPAPVPPAPIPPVVEEDPAPVPPAPVPPAPVPPSTEDPAPVPPAPVPQIIEEDPAVPPAPVPPAVIPQGKKPPKENPPAVNKPDIQDIPEVYRCGKKMKKVLVCHVPPGNPANAHSLCISLNGAINGHGVPLDGTVGPSSGDRLGLCNPGDRAAE